jgi:O-antigen/teichoic acid export membrane protein
MSRELTLIFSQRLWQAVAGLITVIFVTRYLSADEQGWYYTFVSLAALYSVFEMGLSSALVQSAGHVFKGLRWLPQGSLEGQQRARVFKSFLGQAVRVYIRLAVAFTLLIVLIGFAYFSLKSQPAEDFGNWRGPWFGLVLATASAMMTLPFLAIVEGTGAIVEVYFVRLLQGVVGSASCWVMLATGASMWATAAVPAASTLVAIIWVLSYRRQTLYIAMLTPDQIVFNWKIEISHLQRRVGVSWIGVYIMSQLATPILFYFQDPVIAGQMGLTLTVAHMLGLLAQASMARVVPAMSAAVASCSWQELDRLFRRGLIGYIVVFAFGAVGVGLAYELISTTTYASRMLPVEQLIELFIFVFVFQLNAALSSQLRAFRREPLAWVYAVGAVFTLVGSLAMASTESAAGVVWVMLLVQLGIVFPLSLVLWRYNLRHWRKDI